MIATHARPVLLARTLESLTRAMSREWVRAVWILENGSIGQVEALCRRFSDRLPIRYWSSPVSGKSRAQQAVLPDVGDDLLLFLDDDVRVGERIFDAYGEAASSAGEGHFFGGPLHIDYEVAPPAWLLRHLPLSVVGFTPFKSRKGSRDWEFLGANFAAFANDVRRVGGFETDFGPGVLNPGSEGNPLGDEALLQKRLLAGGCKAIAVNDALVWHWVPRERCTPAWALHRAQRQAMTAVLRDPEKPSNSRGVPRWLIKELATKLPNLVRSYVTIDAEQRFRRKVEFYSRLGHAQGYRLRRRLATRHPPKAESRHQGNPLP
jgi:hypothetical protein